MSENDRKRRRLSDKVWDEVQAGQDARTRGDLDAALQHFSKAMQLDDNDPFGVTTDMLLVYFEMGKYNECIAHCIRAEERHLRNSKEIAELRALVLSVKGTAYLKLAKCAEDCDIAIDTLVMALSIHMNRDTLERLKQARSEKQELEMREQSGQQERELGDKLYMKNRPEAVKHYTQAIEFNPRDVKAYSSRAFCYTSDGMLAEGLEDAEKCIELDPTFVKAYFQKGNIEFEKKEYSKALETYEMGLKHDGENKDLLDAIIKCREQVQPAADQKDVAIE